MLEKFQRATVVTVVVVVVLVIVLSNLGTIVVLAIVLMSSRAATMEVNVQCQMSENATGSQGLQHTTP